MSQTEPRNPFYLLLLVASLLFVATALAYGVVPILVENGRQAGQAPVPLPFSDALRAHGWKWLLWELAAMVLFASLSMGLDRLRTLKKERRENTIPQSNETGPSR
jgi:amino acid transporter